MNTIKSSSDITNCNSSAAKRRQRVGIMGGTFDPIHIGHLILAESAYEEFQLDKVLIMPSGNPPHKPVREGGATNQQRVQMVSKAIEDNAHFELSLVEMHEMGYIYTSKTLQTLTKQNPDTDYYFIMGADSLQSFDTWKDPDIICSLCTLVVAVRDHLEPEDLDAAIHHVSRKYHARILKLSTLNIDISSHQIREWTAGGKSCRYYLPDSVIRYIREKDIYRNGSVQ